MRFGYYDIPALLNSFIPLRISKLFSFLVLVSFSFFPNSCHSVFTGYGALRCVALRLHIWMGVTAAFFFCFSRVYISVFGLSGLEAVMLYLSYAWGSKKGQQNKNGL